MDTRMEEIVNAIEHYKLTADDPFHFHCTQCGKCCINREDILLTPLDLFLIANELKLSLKRIHRPVLRVVYRTGFALSAHPAETQGFHQTVSSAKKSQMLRPQSKTCNVSHVSNRTCHCVSGRWNCYGKLSAEEIAECSALSVAEIAQLEKLHTVHDNK